MTKEGIGLPGAEEIYRMTGIRPGDLGLYHQAFIHSSYANQYPEEGWQSNERLEFLGDAVVDLAMADYLFRRHPAEPEGQLTRVRASLVGTASLAARARSLGLNRWVRLGKGEEQSGGREREALLEDLFEALAAAVYLDAGWEAARRFVVAQLGPTGEERKAGEGDAKSRLQEWAQQAGRRLDYRLLDERGPDHDKRFTVAVLVDDREQGTGEGRSKKEAEQAAAAEALERLAGPKK